ncbi:hypothetical protein TWF506_004391 [Arthrobotrys conoides]|uniref:BTB domain-containing protein n=1 Tax=Arthrobotrys conoides TaxID=74498 RepID=A0AAN8MWW5_9PEZI
MSSSNNPNDQGYLPPLPRTTGLGSLQSKLQRAKSLSEPWKNPTELPIENKRTSVHIPVPKKPSRGSGYPWLYANTLVSPETTESSIPSDSTLQAPFEQSTLMKILENPQFSDITVYIGTSKTPFHLHREIISLTSNFFKDFCTALRTSKTTVVAEIYLPHLDPKIFKTVVIWQYSDTLHFSPTSTPAPLIPLYHTIEFLKVPTLRTKYFNILITSCRTDFCNLTETSREVFLRTFNDLCNQVKPSDLGSLIECMEVIVEHFVVLPDAFLEALQIGAVSNVFVAAFIGARENLGHWRSCARCFEGTDEGFGRRGGANHAPGWF